MQLVLINKTHFPTKAVRAIYCWGLIASQLLLAAACGDKSAGPLLDPSSLKGDILDENVSPEVSRESNNLLAATDPNADINSPPLLTEEQDDTRSVSEPWLAACQKVNDIYFRTGAPRNERRAVLAIVRAGMEQAQLNLRYDPVWIEETRRQCDALIPSPADHREATNIAEPFRQRALKAVQEGFVHCAAHRPMREIDSFSLAHEAKLAGSAALRDADCDFHEDGNFCSLVDDLPRLPLDTTDFERAGQHLSMRRDALLGTSAGGLFLEESKRMQLFLIQENRPDNLQDWSEADLRALEDTMATFDFLHAMAEQK